MAKPTYITPNLEEWLSKFRFHTTIKVRYCETDMSGHVNNTSYPVYFEQARTEFLESLDILDLDLMVVTADIWCHYHAEAFFAEELAVGVRVARIGNSSIDLEYHVTKMKDHTLVATGAGTIVVIDKMTRKPASISTELRERIARQESSTES